MSKQELAYKVMKLPSVRRSFSDVSVVGFYHRANLTENFKDGKTIVYSDRTEYSAYAERCNDKTEVSNRKNAVNNILTKEDVAQLSFREFAETISHEWIKDPNVKPDEIGPETSRKFMSRDINSGHWKLKRRQKRQHVRFSTVLYTQPPHLYDKLKAGETTTQTNFFELKAEDRKQLYRAYMELVCYVPWKNTPEETFIRDDVDRAMLKDTLLDPECDQRYSRKRLELFLDEYNRRKEAGEIAPPGSQWHRDNQYSYSMYLIDRHNVDVHGQRIEGKGVLKPQFEPAEELENINVDINLDIHDEADLSDFPCSLNFLPPDTFREVLQQKPPTDDEISVAFPLQPDLQKLEEMVSVNKSQRFKASPPAPRVPLQGMTVLQQKAVELGTNMEHKILYLCGKAGSGKTEVALHICEQLSGHVQAGAGTGKAATNFNGPTVHAMFGWSYDGYTGGEPSQLSPNQITDLKRFYNDTDVFVIDEVNAMSAEALAQLDETMTQIFNSQRKTDKPGGEVYPFGNKKMVFLGDPAQLSPIAGEPIYGGGSGGQTKAARVRGSRGRNQSKYNRTARGQELYRKYLQTNCIYLERGQRNSGKLQEICDRLRNGEQTEDDLKVLTYQRRRFPEVTTDCGIHYDNETCSLYNWRQLWSECKAATPPRRLHICKATYHTTIDNDRVVAALAALPPTKFQFASDVLCVADGCDVRLIKNLNVAAGLVNSASGKVVKVIYNNADVPALREGKNPPPYCIVVDFPGFLGFPSPTASDAQRRVFPFVNKPHWVPVYRQSFIPAHKDLTSAIIKKQSPNLCYREQFPLDLSRHITTHRAQGQTLANCTVSVDLGLENPDRQLPSDISAIIYVACTRVTELRNLFLGTIFLSTWEKIGQSTADHERRETEVKLKKAAKQFASEHAFYKEMDAELKWKPDYSTAEDEWKQLKSEVATPDSHHPQLQDFQRVPDDELVGQHSRGEFQFAFRPVNSERHIGLDQGRRNFGIAVVDKYGIGQPPVLVAAENYDLHLSDNFTASALCVQLAKQTPLLNWMQQCNTIVLPHVDRVVVHIEQMCIKNKSAKEFGIRFGEELQRKAPDVKTCIVKLSQPHNHGSSGPVFKLGKLIVDELQLIPISSQRKRTTQPSRPLAAKRSRIVDTDVEPSSDTDTNGADEYQNETKEYAEKKRMSAKIFNYFVQADDAKQLDMGVKVEDALQKSWKTRLEHKPRPKLDDVGDALLHSLKELLCGGSCYKQLVPPNSALQCNRTIVLSVQQDMTYWIVIRCTWNIFELENFGFYGSHVLGKNYKDATTVTSIRKYMDCDLLTALSDMKPTDIYKPVDHIKMVVKQLKGFRTFTNKQAGALTQATANALKEICDECAGGDSQLCDQKDSSSKQYIRTNLKTGSKFQLLWSTGKQTNAMLACLSWMMDNAKNFVETRTQHMATKEKLLFFNALVELAKSTDIRLEMIQLSDSCKQKMTKQNGPIEQTIKMMLADLILIGISKNQQHVKAVAANYRKIVPRYASTAKHQDTSDPTIN